MKILFLLDDFPPITYTSASIIAHNLAKGLLKKGHEIFVITSTRDKTEQGEEECEGLKIFRIYSNYHIRWKAYLSLYNPQVISKVKEIIKEIKPDIVHFHYIHGHLSYYCLKIARQYAKGVFLTAHDVMLIHYEKFLPRGEKDICKISAWEQIKTARKRYNPFRNIIIKHYLRYVDKIFAVSNSLKRLLEVNGIKNVEVIHNGINVDDWKVNTEKVREFMKKYNLYGKKIILFGGRLSGAKGRDVILEAMATITKKVKNAVLVVVGKVDDFNQRMIDLTMTDLAKKFDAKKHIIFTGWLNRDELKVAYHSTDISVFPSICFETFGMNNLEAMVCKKPVVSSYFGGPGEVVLDPAKGGTDEQTGYLVDPNNIKLMAEKIIDLLKNPQKAKQFGEAGYKRARKKFSFSNQMDKTLKWYKKFSD